MKNYVFVLMVLVVLQLSARTIAQDAEVYELKSKLEYAEDFLKLQSRYRPKYDQNNQNERKRQLNQQLRTLAAMEAQLENQNGIQRTGFGAARVQRATRLPKATVQQAPEKSPEVLENENRLKEQYAQEKADLEKQLSSIDEKEAAIANNYKVAKDTIAKIQDAYDKALRSYFEIELPAVS